MKIKFIPNLPVVISRHASSESVKRTKENGVPL
jgi:hypothetical protein